MGDFFKRFQLACVVAVLSFIVGGLITMWERRPPKGKILVLPETLRFRSMSIQEYLAGEGELEEEWRPLSEKEMKKEKEVMVSKALEYGKEWAEELEAPSYVSDGLLWTEETLLSYRDFTERYHVHLKLSAEEAIVRYELEY